MGNLSVMLIDTNGYHTVSSLLTVQIDVSVIIDSTDIC